MTPEEAGSLANFGISILHGVTWLTTISVLEGVFALLFAASTFLLIRQDSRTPLTWVMLLVTTIFFLVATLHWGAEISAIAIGVRSSLVDNIDLPQSVRQQIADGRTLTANRISVWTQFLPIVGNATIVWRACVLLVNNPWVMIAPIVLLLATISMTFAFLASTMKLSAAENFETVFLLSTNYNTSRLAFSLATNVVATSLILYRIWNQSKVIGGVRLGSRKSRKRIPLLLIESGVMYCVLQSVVVGLSLADAPPRDSARNFASQVILSAYNQISAMHPTIVVLLITTERSFADTYGFNTVRLAVFGRHSYRDTESRPGTGRSMRSVGSTKLELTRTLTRG